jgi:HAD superfamily hydrolase (TIGR01509 family)
MKLVIPSGEFDAYLFDCDGTIADSMPLHLRAWTRAVEARGGSFPEELFYAWAGVPHERTVALLNERLGTALPVAETARHKEALYEAILEEVQPIAAVVAEIERLHGRAPLAVVSGGPRVSVRRTLAALGLLEKFAALVCAEDCARGKPHPDPFLRAAELLNVRAERCLVFEDAEGGILAAEAAGMQFVRVPRRGAVGPGEP